MLDVLNLSATACGFSGSVKNMEKRQTNQEPAEFLVSLSILNCTMLHLFASQLQGHFMLCYALLFDFMHRQLILEWWEQKALYSLCHPFGRVGGVLSLGFCSTRWCYISAKPLAQWRRLSRVSSTHGFGCENRPVPTWTLWW